MPNDDTLVRVWAEIQAITAWLCRRGVWPRFVPGVGNMQVVEHAPEAMTRLRAIFAVHGKRIEAELPDDLRDKPWGELLVYPAKTSVEDRVSSCVERTRVVERLHETATFQVEKYRAAALVQDSRESDHEREGTHPNPADPERMSGEGAGGGQGTSIHVENFVMGDQIAAQDSTVVARSELDGSARIVRDDHSTTGGSKPQPWIARVSENVVAQVLAGLVVIFIVAIVIMKWPWIKEFLG